RRYGRWGQCRCIPPLNAFKRPWKLCRSVRIMEPKKGLSTLALLAALAVGNTGCIKATLLNGQIEATRKASAAVDTVGDYEVAQGAGFRGLAQFEGLHYLAPENEDALFLLAKGWAGATYAFIEDQMEQAEDAEGTESPLYLYQHARAQAGYDRAIHYGS